MTPLLEARGLTKVYRSGTFNRIYNPALVDFSLTIHEDEPTIISIAGESGSGKTTAANLLLGLIQPSGGHLLYRGQDMTTPNSVTETAYRSDVQAIFQDPFEVFNPFYKVDRVLRAVIRRFKLASGKRDIHSLMCEALEAVGLRPDDMLGKYPHELSGGQRQRIMIARAFLLQPRLIIADEPVSMLDASLRGLILEIMLRLKNEHGMSFIYVTQDLSTAYQISDQIMILYKGRTVEEGHIDSVIKTPKHPYTQLLIGAVPIPDPQQRWVTGRATTGQQQTTPSGCPFASRCPQVMAHCKQHHPEQVTVGKDHTAACFLYDDKVTTTSNLTEMV